MGKISKALEKAERQNATRPVEQPAPDRIEPDWKAAQFLAKSKAVVQSDQGQATDPLNRDLEPVQRPVDAQPPASSDRHQHATPASAPSTVQPAESFFESNRVPKSDTSRKADGVNIALLKPEITQPPRPVQRVAWKTEAEENSTQAAADSKATSGKAVRVRYTRTQIQINDPERLRNNKIITVFDDMETTDQIRILRTQVLRKLKAIGGNSILVTSANPCEGKTFTSINLGVSIAKEFDRTVLIIDADLRKPTQQHTAFSTEFFSLKVDKGLTDYLEGDADISEILINPGIDKLTLIPGGMPVDNAPELLNSAMMQEMMSEVKSRYASDRLVIVDGPAILPFPDAMILSRYVDGVLPVVEAEKTSTEDLKKMMNHLKEVNILGTVLNKNKG